MFETDSSSFSNFIFVAYNIPIVVYKNKATNMTVIKQYRKKTTPNNNQ